MPEDYHARKEVRGATSFETFGFYPILAAPLLFFSSLFLMAIWVGHILGIPLFGLLSLLFLVFSVARIKISENDVIVDRTVLGTSFWGFDEISFKAGGRLLIYGGRTYGGWIMPFRWRECHEVFETLRSRRTAAYQTSPSRVLPLVCLLAPLVLLFMAGRIARYFGIAMPPLAWALLWALGMAFSASTYLSMSPIRVRIGSLDKKQTAAVIGLTFGLITFAAVFLIYEIANVQG